MHLAGGSVQSNVYRRFDTWNDSRDIFRVFLTWVETTDNGLFCVKGHALFFIRTATSALLYFSF